MTIKDAKIICILLLLTLTVVYCKVHEKQSDGSYVEQSTSRINLIPDTEIDANEDQKASIFRAPHKGRMLRSCPSGQIFQFGRCRTVSNG